MNYLALFCLFFCGIQFSNAQDALEVQQHILDQYEKLIPSDASFASWTLYEVDFNGDSKKDYVFSYILCNKYKRQLHAGSGLLMLTKGKDKKYNLYGHIPSADKDIYFFSNFKNDVFYINEYDAKANYQKVKRKLKFKKKGNKFVSI